MAIQLGFGLDKTTNTQSGSTQKVLTQEGIDKIIYDVMSSDQGLSGLAAMENSSGGYNSTTKSLMAQDLITKLVGEIANITAPTVTSSSTSQTKKSGGVKTVICTELMRQGLLDEELYAAGRSHFLTLHPYVVRGYQSWATKIVPILAKNPRLAKFLAPVAVKRYEYIVLGRKTLTGLASVHLAQPVCFAIGAVLQFVNPETPGEYLGRFISN